MVIKFGGLGPKRRFSHYSGLKFGGMVQYRHMYMHTEKMLADFNLVVYRYNAKTPNLIPHQIFQLYGNQGYLLAMTESLVTTLTSINFSTSGNILNRHRLK